MLSVRCYTLKHANHVSHEYTATAAVHSSNGEAGLLGCKRRYSLMVGIGFCSLVLNINVLLCRPIAFKSKAASLTAWVQFTLFFFYEM